MWYALHVEATSLSNFSRSALSTAVLQAFLLHLTLSMVLCSNVLGQTLPHISYSHPVALA
jgi:hypothetical protein